MEQTNERNILPKNLKPISYNLQIQPNFKDDTFNGEVFF
jgi:hypothetical protein